jgi:hypothetical protein
MADPYIATSAEQPINSDGAVSTIAGGEGALVGLNSDGELVQADAATGPANFPAEGGDFEFARTVGESQYNTINEEKVGYVRYGVEVHNRDEDWNFTPGEPVYLAEGGGFTQTEPSNSGDLVQCLGYAIEAEYVMLEIDADYNTV